MCNDDSLLKRVERQLGVFRVSEGLEPSAIILDKDTYGEIAIELLNGDVEAVKDFSFTSLFGIPVEVLTDAAEIPGHRISVV